jgi:flagellar protein FlaG
MEVKPPVLGVRAFSNANSVAGTSQNVKDVESFAPILQSNKIDLQDTAANQEDFEQKDVLRDVVKRTAELLSIGDRGLKYEMIEEADMYQLQVIDMTDGRVVRKVPPDEVINIIKNLKEQIADHVDVMA